MPDVTLAMKDAAVYMRAHFEYKSDGLIDEWEIGATVGDCEDFALTVLYLICGRSKARAVKALLSGRARLIFTETPKGNGHAVLEYGGHYIDNRYPTWSKRWRYEIKRPYSRLMISLKLATGKVLA